LIRDLRRYARQTNIQLAVGGLLILFVVGVGLIWIIYGRNSAILGLLCLVAGLSPLGLIGLALWIMDWFVKRAGRE